MLLTYKPLAQGQILPEILETIYYGDNELHIFTFLNKFDTTILDVLDHIWKGET